MSYLTPQDNLARLALNPYPGRGIIIGTDDIGRRAIQVYWIMGRSKNSRNRVFACDGGRLYTEAADPAKMEDPSLVIYNAMDEVDGCFVVSNGDQTDLVIETLEEDRGSSLHDALIEERYEPDAPNFTPRITGICELIGGVCYNELAILRQSDLLNEKCVRFFYKFFEINPGIGFCLTTYQGDGEPLPAFVGEPYPVPLVGEPEHILETYWQSLNPENLVALAVKAIDFGTEQSKIAIRNRFEKVAS
jgi:IMP cyclohydrolase